MQCISFRWYIFRYFERLKTQFGFINLLVERCDPEGLHQRLMDRIFSGPIIDTFSRLFQFLSHDPHFLSHDLQLGERKRKLKNVSRKAVE